MRVLAIETSCDDTSVAIVCEDRRVLICQSANQDLAHEPFGGIVPEVASRNHTSTLMPLIDQVLKKSGLTSQDLSGITVTARPGLIGSLLVGVVTAKTLAAAWNLPLIGVNHIEGHLLAPFLIDDEFAAPSGFDFPYVGLAVSGGHSHLFLVSGVGRYQILGATVDDAAGEAFDKFAKMLGLGFPGGAAVDRLAKTGDANRFTFPRAMLKEDNLNFSFSGLKTAAQLILNRLEASERREMASDLCASFQEAVVDVLVQKLERAAQKTGLKRVVLTGGVSANSRLRVKALQLQERGYQVVIPPLRYCTDNAAMIGWVGVEKLRLGQIAGQDLAPSAQAHQDDYLQ